MTTRRHEEDEGTYLLVNAGQLVETRTAGAPPGTLIEVLDLFCNVPARRKFLRAAATEESHVRSVFTTHALAHPDIAFSLQVDGREVHRLARADSLIDRVRDLFGTEFLETLVPLNFKGSIEVAGLIEKPSLFTPTRRDQYVFVNGRPASAPSIAYALREAYPRQPGDVRPAAILLLTVPPTQVDVNVHPTKREVRFRDNSAVKHAITEAVSTAFAAPREIERPVVTESLIPAAASAIVSANESTPIQPEHESIPLPPIEPRPIERTSYVAPIQEEIKLEVSSDGHDSKPWVWFKFLAQTSTGYLLIETDSGIVTINPIAARQRIAYERLLSKSGEKIVSQTLLVPETVTLSSPDMSRLMAAHEILSSMGFHLEEFGTNVIKVDAVPNLMNGHATAQILSTIAHDLAEPGLKRSGAWREELIAKSLAKSYAGASSSLTAEGAARLVEELTATRMPYVCPRGKPILIFTSTRELNRKFDRD